MNRLAGLQARPRVDQLTMLCFPHAGGAAAAYSRWAKDLPGVLVRPVELPGRGERSAESPLDSVDALVEDITRTVLPELGGRFALFGHSMGALIAFEFAHRLRQRFGLRPVRLLVSGYGPPDQPGNARPRRMLSDDDLWDEVRTLNGTPDAIHANDEVRRLCMPAIRADFTLVETYRYQARRPLDCGVSVFGADGDPEVRVEDLADWGRHTSAGHTVTVLPGDHFFLHHDPGRFLDKLSREMTIS